MKGLITTLLLLFICVGCSGDSETDPPAPPQPPQVENEVDFYLTTGDQSQKFKKQTGLLAFGTLNNTYPSIEISTIETYQTVEGFGFTLTGGSADVINSLNNSKKQELLQKLFGSNEDGIGISYLRISVGASDLDASAFTYNDLPEGQTDEDLSDFSLEPNMDNVIPLLQEILKINPDLGIMATPWSPPVWMKDNDSTIGGNLQPEYYDVYADYLVKYIQEMKKLGIPIHALTPQNEPLHAGNNPSMHMTASEQADFIKNALGPAFENAGIETKIIIYDHNADNPDYPISVLNDPDARQYVAGSAFHLYGGDISALSTVHDAYPNKDIYFTEQYTSSQGEFGGDLKWHLRNVIIGSMRNWSKTALEWNLANNANYGPHTDGGCTTCKGAVTISSSSSYTENVGFYIIAHASKFVSPGSVRISSNIIGDLYNVAFRTPSGDKVLIVLNNGNSSQPFNIEFKGEWITSSLNPGAVGTYVWE
ncbi:glycoside hydrolase family 30 protein [Salinimicrobium sediminilitoris]|uniref:glycoside hydrolase family 30 protein n=1 Tax=Salinimicrobium sediminilitoris TaxID=2876715 RepID=UPI001E431C45|nr:glycoside hydrolase family 30 beta sandwich domain-containing protein [Salinimicrobium sediminilitoris]MCC8359672.1 glucosylceramidase [Salinimicrobium sediminilitoris]